MPVRAFVSKELPSELSKKLREAGIEFLALPLIKTVPVEFDPEEVLSFSPEAVIFSSKNGVKFFFSRILPEELREAQFIAVGSSTAQELKKLGFSPIIPANFSAEGLVELLKGREVKGKRFLVVRPKKARSLVQDFLKERGAEVREVVVYQTLPGEEVKEELLKFFSSKVDCAAFTSPSNFNAFLQLAGGERLKGVKIIPIGHVTRRAVEKAGFSCLPPPSEYTLKGVVDCLLELVREGR